MSYLTFWAQNAPVKRVNLLIVNEKMLPLIRNKKIKNKNKFLGIGCALGAWWIPPPGTPAPVQFPPVLNPRNVLQYNNIITFPDSLTTYSPCIYCISGNFRKP